jgi:mitogen-activated protein kinase kinase kinase
MLDSKCTVKLSDFGCSKGFEKTVSLIAYENSQGKSFRGTAFWLAPEAIKEGRYTRKTDIWSLGCTLLELATCKFPWD